MNQIPRHKSSLRVLILIKPYFSSFEFLNTLFKNTIYLLILLNLDTIIKI